MNNRRQYSQRARIMALVLLVPMLTAARLQAGEIHDAAAAGDLNKVRALLEADPTLLESKDGLGDTPLISACDGKQWAVANFLIDKGANIQARDNPGATPLFFAARDFDLSQRLVAIGADVNARAFVDYSYTPLHTAAGNGNLKVAKLLIDHGADLNFRGSVGTVLQRIIYNREESATEMAKLLLESGARLQEFSFGNTELHLAVLRGYAEIIPLLVKHGADVNATNQYGHTPLYYATRHGYRKAAEALIAAGANKSAVVETNYGKAPQLSAKLKEGEAYLWFLGGGSPGTGYAVKTKDHLLIFNPSGIDDSPEAGLANGYVNPAELAGQKVTVLITQGADRPVVSELARRLPGANFVLSFKPASDGAGNGGLPPYRIPGPHESFSMGGIHVITIPAARHVNFLGAGVGYLVEADGVKVFHAGLHASNNEATQIEKFRREIDFLKSFRPIDIAILPVNGRHLDIAYEPYLYLLDRLSPKAVFLDGDDLRTEEHRKCIKVLQTRNVHVEYPDGGLAVGQRFHYRRSQTREAQLPQPAAAAGVIDEAVAKTPPLALDVTYIANEGFLIRAGGKKVLTDAPIVAPPEANPRETVKAITEGREPFNDLDLILITHRHADHLDPAGLIACLRSNPRARLPMLSPDGKYLFFTRWTPDHDHDVYWVDAATIPALRPMTNPPQENLK